MLDFANFWIFLLLPLPWIIYHVLKAAPENSLAALRIPFFSAIHVMVENTHPHDTQPQKRLVIITWVLLIIAAAGPQWLGKPIPLPVVGRDILLAVDLSGSMQTPDMLMEGQAVDRLTSVKNVAKEFIEKRAGDKLGLILFGTRAYLQTPLTFDHKTVLAMLDDATIALAGPQTAIGDAIGLAIKRLSKVPEKSRVLILLTDGGNNSGVLDPLQAAKIAADNKIKIYTVGVGSNGVVVNGVFGPQLVNPSSDLDEDTLKKIADMTHGEFFRATDHDSLQKIYQTINRLEPSMDKQVVFRPAKDLFYWPLAIALLISLYLLRRKIL
ncbi:MAG: VWA domain-containing protein [Proteobacteria bacterium]|nr:VWA domain-containing protein [Pseudomonadota bacterium]